MSFAADAGSETHPATFGEEVQSQGGDSKDEDQKSEGHESQQGEG
jgi:hypothetical protein